jgi:hypothetical protein
MTEEIGSSATVAVQVPSLSKTRDSFAFKTLEEVEARFDARKTDGGPWNILDFRSSLPNSSPSCFVGENCSLLGQMRDLALAGDNKPRDEARPNGLIIWKQVESWPLVAQAGADTLPHQDANGFESFLWLVQGELLFGWMKPTEDNLAGWRNCRIKPRNQGWRYKVMREGDNVMLEPVLVHFVSRLSDAEDTLILGGHFWRWSSINDCMRVTISQLRFLGTTNEDVRRTAPEYVRLIKTLVDRETSVERRTLMGGDEGIKTFYELYEVRQRLTGKV